VTERRRLGRGNPPNSGPDYEVGYKRPPRKHQFKTGHPSANPKGRPRGSSNQTVNLHKILMEPVSITKGGRKRKVPFPAAHLQRIMERAAKGDPKADQALFQLYKTMHLFDSEESNTSLEFTMDIGPVPKNRGSEDGGESAATTQKSRSGSGTATTKNKK
jgi:Family of unknown function (DUF5681)